MSSYKNDQMNQAMNDQMSVEDKLYNKLLNLEKNINNIMQQQYCYLQGSGHLKFSPEYCTGYQSALDAITYKLQGLNIFTSRTIETEETEESLKNRINSLEANVADHETLIGVLQTQTTLLLEKMNALTVDAAIKKAT